MRKEEFLNRKLYNADLQLIQDIYLIHEEQFKNYFEIWNQKLRLFISDTMGVKLSDEKTKYKITIEIDPVFDGNYLDKIERYGDFRFSELQEIKQYLESGVKIKKYLGSEEMTDDFDRINKYLSDRILEKYTQKMAIDFFQKPIEKGLSSEIFGTYFSNNSRIEIYIVPIILYCKSYNCNPEELFIIILAHELAHAYSHIGKDKDDLIWENFNEVSTEIKESIAQYYTSLYIKKLAKKPIYNIQKVFDEFNSIQHQIYREHLNWKTDKEAVFSTLIEVRRRNIREFKEFNMLLSNRSDVIKKSKN